VEHFSCFSQKCSHHTKRVPLQPGWPDVLMKNRPQCSHTHFRQHLYITFFPRKNWTKRKKGKAKMFDCFWNLKKTSTENKGRRKFAHSGHPDCNLWLARCKQEWTMLCDWVKIYICRYVHRYISWICIWHDRDDIGKYSHWNLGGGVGSLVLNYCLK
jgi:hypothetical protein